MSDPTYCSMHGPGARTRDPEQGWWECRRCIAAHEATFASPTVPEPDEAEVLARFEDFKRAAGRYSPGQAGYLLAESKVKAQLLTLTASLATVRRERDDFERLWQEQFDQRAHWAQRAIAAESRLAAAEQRVEAIKREQEYGVRGFAAWLEAQYDEIQREHIMGAAIDYLATPSSGQRTPTEDEPKR